MATTATKTEHSNSNTASHSGHATTHKAATKTAGKRRGGYSFGAASADDSKASVSKKGARRTGTAAKKKSTSSRSTASRSSTASKASSHRAGASSARSGRSALDLGFASIAKSASDSARQNTATLNRSANKASTAFNGAFANVASNAKQVQEKVTDFSRGISSNLKQTASRAAENTTRSLEMHRQNAEALGQSYSAAQSAMKEASQEIFSFFNNAFNQNVEAARAALECRNIGELFQIHNDLAKQNLESAFEQALRMSEIAIETATQAIEPLNASVTKNAKKFSQYNA